MPDTSDDDRLDDCDGDAEPVDLEDVCDPAPVPPGLLTLTSGAAPHDVDDFRAQLGAAWRIP